MRFAQLAALFAGFRAMDDTLRLLAHRLCFKHRLMIPPLIACCVVVTQSVFSVGEFGTAHFKARLEANCLGSSGSQRGFDPSRPIKGQLSTIHRPPAGRKDYIPPSQPGTDFSKSYGLVLFKQVLEVAG